MSRYANRVMYGFTEKVSKSEIEHMRLFTRQDMLDAGFTENEIWYLGPPDFRIKRGRYNTQGSQLFWKLGRVLRYQPCFYTMLAARRKAKADQEARIAERRAARVAVG